VAHSTPNVSTEVLSLAHSQRGWTGARTPSAVKRVRQGLRRRAINQPRRSAAKTLVVKALASAGNGDAEQTREALLAAVSALDLAAKTGAIHRNAAARRKSRLMLKVGSAMGGNEVVGVAKVARTTGKAAATKEAKARIAAGKATKAKGAQTAAGKARAALARSSREAAAETAKAEAPTKTTATKATTAKPATKTTAKTTTAKTTTAKTTAKASTKTAAKSTTAKATTAKSSASTKATTKPRSSKTAKSS
jgi:ribosomal protein S20